MRATRARPEKAIEAEIVQNLRKLGFGVTKTSQPRKPTGMTRGIPDLYAAHERWRLRLWIEVKAEGNAPSPYQLAWHAQERASGGTVVVAWSWSDVQRALADVITEIPYPSPSPSSPPPSAPRGKREAGPASSSAARATATTPRSATSRRAGT